MSTVEFLQVNIRNSQSRRILKMRIYVQNQWTAPGGQVSGNQRAGWAAVGPDQAVHIPRVFLPLSQENRQWTFFSPYCPDKNELKGNKYWSEDATFQVRSFKNWSRKEKLPESFISALPLPNCTFFYTLIMSCTLHLPQNFQAPFKKRYTELNYPSLYHIKTLIRPLVYLPFGME